MDLPNGVLDALRRYVSERPQHVAYRFLSTGEVDGPIVEWTYERLYTEVRAVAATLREQLPAGSRCLLLFPPGLDFVAGFLGCLWAGIVAVPAYLPNVEQSQPRALRRMLGVLRDCEAAAVLTAPDDVGLARLAAGLDPAFGVLTWLRRAETPAQLDSHIDGIASPGQVAFLQYTSGSTGDPKGVMVSHENLANNLRMQQAAWQQDAANVVTWLPIYHDMGLIGGLLYPLFVGGTATLMSPAAFIARPARWLRAVSHFRGTLSLAPNFGYELCVRKVPDADLPGLDLSTWAVAVNGAEPVRGSTPRAFVDRFAAAGFDSRAVVLGYGLAEATLFVTSTRRGEWDASGTTSCGTPALGTQVLVVDPETATPVPDGEVGEVWVQGPGNSLGYWQRPADTADTFQARLAGGDGPYLRTGDLGVLDATGLHVRGRLKDLIIVDGVNHYPQDIEQTVEQCHPAVRAGCVAAFAVDVDDREQVVVVAEVAAAASERPGVLSAIQAAVLREYPVPVHEVVLIRPRTIPKTSSGKIQRRETAARYAAGALDVHSVRPAPAPAADPVGALVEEPARATVAGVRTWLLSYLAAVIGVPVSDIRATDPFDRYGLESRDVVALTVEMGGWLGSSITPGDVYGHPTVDALARHVAGAAPTLVPVEAVPATEAVAIVGIGCRFPGADGPAGYWSLLSRGTDAIREVPPERWKVEDFFQAGGPAPGRMYTRSGGFIDDVGQFDAAFFGLSDTEARYLDPQQRLLLEMAWAAMEDAGVSPTDLAGSATGVYIGLTTGDYAQMMAAAEVGAGPYAATGNVACMAANRVSYTFDLRGPSLTVDTACSSSLVAIHQACSAIRAGEIDTALAGGVNLMLSPLTTVALCQSGALSPDGRCYTFDARANGYARGEGAGLVLLKPLSRALADGDRVYAVIRGSAVNQDGRSNGLTAPNPQAHAQVIRKAYHNAGLDPGRMQYVEAHGTGTALGDPIEAGAVGMVLDGVLPPGELRAIGSVKTNFGHLEAAAGAAGLIKVALALYHRQLPASLHHETTNPHIDLDALGLRIPGSLEAWPSLGAPRVGGVNSFGVGGTNAHMVLEEAPAANAIDEKPDGGTPRLLVLSGRTPSAVADLARRFADFLPDAEATLDTICHTAGLRRTHHEHRLATVASSTAELSQRLALGTAASVTGRAQPGADRRIVFVFPGQGAQHVGMARGLYAYDRAFRAAFDECERHMLPHLDWSPRVQLHSDEPTARLGEEQVVQPLLFAIQVALADAWRDRGVQPDAVVGHSMGEVAAAYVAGVLDLADAAELTCVRARLLAEVQGQGAMAVVGLHHTAVQSELAAYEGRLHLAAANGPALSVVSGDKAAVDDFRTRVERRGVFARSVRASGAGHSPVVEPVAGEVARRFAGLRPKPADIPLYSSVTGAQISSEKLTGSYWGRNLRDTVLFLPAVERLAAEGYRLFLEMSPNPTLVVPIQQALDEQGNDGRAIGSLVRGRDDREAFLEAFGALHSNGATVDLGQVLAGESTTTTLPTAPWQRQEYWFTGDGAAVSAAADVSEAVANAFAGVLRLAEVPPDASFFELGGSSLMAAQMLYDLRSRLERDIPLRLLFEHPTVAGFSDALRSGRHVSRSTAPLIRADGDVFPLTFNQQRLLYDDPGRTTGIIAQHIRLDGPIDLVALEAALSRLLDLHEGLRTELVDGGQRIAPATTPVLSIVDTDEAGLPQLLRETETGVEPGYGSLFRFRVHRLDSRQHVLSIIANHLITDGWSQGVLFTELCQAYEARLSGTADGLVPPPVRLVDFAAWQRARYADGELEREFDSWRARVADAPVPKLPFIAPADGPIVPGVLDQTVPAETADRLAQVAGATATTMPMLVLAAFMVALHRAGGQARLSIPTSAAGRDRPELDRVVGFLSTSHLVTVDLAGIRTGRECLARVRNALLTADEEQGISLSQYSHLAGVPYHAVPYRISMNYLPDIDVPSTFGGAQVELLPRQSPFVLSRDIVLIARREAGALRLSFGYARGVVAEDGLRQLVEHMTDTLDGFAKDLDAPLM